MVHGAGEDWHRPGAVIPERVKEPSKLVRHRDQEQLAGIARRPLAVLKKDGAGRKIDTLPRNTRLPKPTPAMKKNLEHDTHPERAGSKGEADPQNVIVAQIRLLFRGTTPDTHQSNRIAVAKLPAHCLSHEEAQEFDFQAGGIVAGLSRCGSFGQKLPCVLVSDLHRVPDPSGTKKAPQSPPSVPVARQTARILEPIHQKAIHPPVPLPGFRRLARRPIRLLGRNPRLDGPGGPRLRFAGPPQFEAFIRPSSRVAFSAEIPKRRAPNLAERGHISNVPHSSPCASTFFLAFPRASSLNAHIHALVFDYRYTTGQFNPMKFNNLQTCSPCVSHEIDASQENPATSADPAQ
jgi:hypothetical protein